MMTAKYNNDIKFEVNQLEGDSDWRVDEYYSGKWQNSYDDNWSYKEAKRQMIRLAQGLEIDLIVD